MTDLTQLRRAVIILWFLAGVQVGLVIGLIIRIATR